MIAGLLPAHRPGRAPFPGTVKVRHSGDVYVHGVSARGVPMLHAWVGSGGLASMMEDLLGHPDYSPDKGWDLWEVQRGRLVSVLESVPSSVSGASGRAEVLAELRRDLPREGWCWFFWREA